MEKEGAGGEGSKEEDAALLAQAAEEEEELWQLFLKHHEGLRDPVRRVVNKLRALFQRRAYKEVSEGVCIYRERCVCVCENVGVKSSARRETHSLNMPPPPITHTHTPLIGPRATHQQPITYDTCYLTDS